MLLFLVGLPGDLVWSWARIDQSLRIGAGAVVFRDAGQTLTSAGSWTVMIARFAGPVLLALAVLAIRARVKR